MWHVFWAKHSLGPFGQWHCAAAASATAAAATAKPQEFC